MEHVSLARFGQREDFCTLRDRAAMLSRMAEAGLQPCADKWALFSRLRVARSHYGLTDRDLTVLNALLSCHADRSLDPARSLVVFPSNATLSDRAHGMAESTLRRHLAALVRAGLILRRDSPNGKRYALRSAAGQQAFGFDLRPLLCLRAEIEAQADAVEAAAEDLARRRLHLVLRHRDISAVVMALPHALSAAVTPAIPKLALVRSRLRRTMTEPLLEELAATLDAIARLLPAASSHPETEQGADTGQTAESRVSAAHSDRHIQDQHTDSSESKGHVIFIEGQNSVAAGVMESSESAETITGRRPALDTNAPRPAKLTAMSVRDTLFIANEEMAERATSKSVTPSMTAPLSAMPADTTDTTITLLQVKTACPEALCFAPAPVRNWQDLQCLADSLHPHLGVSPDLWARACHAFGRTAAAAVLCLLMERLHSLRSLPAYLGGLVKRSRSVPLSLRALAGWAGREKLTAVNRVGVAG